MNGKITPTYTQLVEEDPAFYRLTPQAQKAVWDRVAARLAAR